MFRGRSPRKGKCPGVLRTTANTESEFTSIVISSQASKRPFKDGAGAGGNKWSPKVWLAIGLRGGGLWTHLVVISAGSETRAWDLENPPPAN